MLTLCSHQFVESPQFAGTESEESTYLFWVNLLAKHSKDGRNILIDKVLTCRIESAWQQATHFVKPFNYLLLMSMQTRNSMNEETLLTVTKVCALSAAKKQTNQMTLD